MKLCMYDGPVEQPTPIKMAGTLSVTDLTRFQYFHSLRLTWPVAVLVAAVVLFLAPSMISRSAGISQSVKNVIPISVPFVMYAFLPMIFARRQYATQPGLRQPLTYTFGEKGYASQGPSASSKWTWDLVQAIRETKTLFVFNHGMEVAMILPKRFFSSSEQMESWRNLVSSHVPAKKIKGIGLLGKWF